MILMHSSWKNKLKLSNIFRHSQFLFVEISESKYVNNKNLSSNMILVVSVHFCCFEVGFHFLALAGLQLDVQTREIFNSQIFHLNYISSARIQEMGNPASLQYFST